jgi:hypothetical protein
VTPKPEKLPAAPKPKRVRVRKPKPPGGNGGRPRGGSVPKVPLVKV